MPPRRVGIIGLGLVGSALAERFLHAGFVVTGFDIDPARSAALVALGGTAADTAAAAAKAGATLVLSLPDSNIVERVLADIVSELPTGTLIVDTTTGDPARTAAVGEQCHGRGVHYLDATIVGSSEQVRDGAVTVLVGGETDIFEECADLFATFCGEMFHLGSWGAGSRMKLVVNLVLGLNRAVLAEGLSFAKACGIDLAETLRVLQSGAAYSRVMDTKGSKMIDGDFTPQARLSQHLKDVRLILATAADHGATVPLSQLHRELLERVQAAGFGDADNAAIIKTFGPSSTPD